MENRTQALGILIVVITVSSVALVPITPSLQAPTEEGLESGIGRAQGSDQPTVQGPVPNEEQNPAQSPSAPVNDGSFGGPLGCAPSIENVVAGAAVEEFLNLSEGATARLSQDCMVAVLVPGWSHDFVGAYEKLQKSGMPLLITSDSVLHAFHIIFDGLLKDLETKVFRPDLVNLSRAIMEESLSQSEVVDSALQPIALRNVAFFAVPLRLLDPNATIPEEVESLVDAEIAHIFEHAGFRPSPIFNSDPVPLGIVTEDYSQYVPRGHYTETPELESYFRAMMWFGRMSFHVESDAELQGAALLGYLWSRQPAQVHLWWERVYDVTAFLVGPSDDLMPNQFASIVKEVLVGLDGNGTALLDPTNLALLRQAAQAAANPRIVSELVPDDNPDGEEPVPVGLRFMGQRFVVDSAVFQELVFDRVTDYGGSGMPFTAFDSGPRIVRAFPRGLDLLDALGSKTAADVLAREGDTDYAGYDTHVGAARALFANLTDDEWNSTAYLRWLRALQAGLADFNSSEYPTFMRGDAYAHQKLNTVLGSWTALRRDTILYAKQSYSARVTGINLPNAPPASYVEPVVAVYERMQELVAATRDTLDELDALDAAWGGRLLGMGWMLENLTSISQSELAGEPLTSEQRAYIRYFADRLDGVLARVSAKSLDTRLVADVHTDQNSGLVLEEATGDLALMVVLVQDPDGQWYAVVGPIFSQYEFKHPMSDRLTDEAWRAMTASGDTPAMAPWVSRFLEA